MTNRDFSHLLIRLKVIRWREGKSRQGGLYENIRHNGHGDKSVAEQQNMISYVRQQASNVALRILR